MDEFKQLICQFCKDNFHYIAQKYFIVLLIKELYEDLSEKLCKSIYEKMKAFLTSDELFDNFRNIYLKIFTDFEKRINEKRDKDGKIYNQNNPKIITLSNIFPFIIQIIIKN